MTTFKDKLHWGRHLIITPEIFFSNPHILFLVFPDIKQNNYGKDNCHNFKEKETELKRG